MEDELEVLRDISLRLEKEAIAYMLTGSMAMNYYAEPRMTRDIDLVVALAPNDTDKIVRLFSPDYYVAREAVSSSIARESLFNLIHQASITKVDFIVRKNTPYRRAEFERRQRVTIEGFSTWIASKEDLVISKLCWARESGSELQLRDVRNLAASGCDEGYIRRWTNELGVQSLWEECKP